VGAGTDVGARGVIIVSMLVFDPPGLHAERRIAITTSRVMKYGCFDDGPAVFNSLG
jgi:hypothetical protein